MKTLVSFVLGVLLVRMGTCAAETTQDCPDKQDPETMKRSYTGRYVNPAEGFDVIIPRGLVGRDFDDPSYQRGFIIFFEHPVESLLVNGEPNSLEWKDAREAAEAYSSSYPDDGRKITSSKGGVLLLDGHKAYTVMKSYTCPSSNVQYSSITTSVLGVDREYVYMLRWEGTSDELEKGRKLMHSLYSTWHFRKPTG